MKNEQGKIEKMNNNINEIIEQSNVFFDNSENIFISLENDLMSQSIEIQKKVILF